MRRRDFLSTAAAAGLARPAVAQNAEARTLVFVPPAGLSSTDPIWTAAAATRTSAFLIYDTLYGLDEKLIPSPQMAAGANVDNDGRRWTLHLREGLLFHDGSRVLARDCVASLRRWMKRDATGATLAGRLEGLEAPDDRTLVFRLARKTPWLAFALGKTQPNPPVIMPERLALTEPFRPVGETIGSGPWRFLPGDYEPGRRAVFSRFDAYRPRDEAADFTSGGKRALVERIEWRAIADPAAAANALREGEVDWIETPLPDLIPQLRAEPGVVVGRLDPYGYYAVLRPNHAIAPTANRQLRQAILASVDPVEVMQSFMGDDSRGYHAPVGCFLPGSESANSAGMDRLGGRKTLAQVREMLRLAGYNGEKLVLLHPTDQPFYDAMSQVVAAQLRQYGFVIDDQAMDWGTLLQRRVRKDPLAAGGWSLFCTSFPAVDYLDPLSAPGLRGDGPLGWYGWPVQPTLEALREGWLDADDAEERRLLTREIQDEAFREGMYAPLGQYFLPSAWRSTVTGQMKGPVPVFFNVQKG